VILSPLLCDWVTSKMTQRIIREFTNMTVSQIDDEQSLILFLGKNPQGVEAAEILNRLQLEGKLFPLGLNQKRRSKGFHRVTYISDNCMLLPDLHEGTCGLSGTLVGPELRPVVFINEKPPVIEDEVNENRPDEDRSGFDNDCGYIMDGPPGHSE